jgi:hypothetical protein
MSIKTTIGVSRECLSELYEAKFDLRVNTIEQVILELLKEHNQRKKSVDVIKKEVL